MSRHFEVDNRVLNDEVNRLKYQVHVADQTIKNQKELLSAINKDVQKWKEQIREQLKFKEWLVANHGDILTTYEVLKRLGELE